ncbi:hypothetical protein D3C78_1965670 [compost metagenome]
MGACSERARVSWRFSSASLRICGTMPTVEMVIDRMPMPTLLLSSLTLLSTLGRFNSGSPMPM